MSRGWICKYLLTSLQNNNKFSVSINQESLETTHQVTHFSDQTPQWDYTVDSMPDSTYGQADSSQAELGDFFNRPIKILSQVWNVGGNIHLTFDPWEAFFENPRVMNRIANFNLLRCKLKVRFVVNGNGFHYGRAIASYNPQNSLDDFTLFRSGVDQDLIAASQRPHVYLDPTNSQGGTLSLPFFHYQNALRIPALDWRSMGEITLSSINNLKHANGATDPITISAFVWAEEVQLSIPTSRNPSGLVPQSGDEYSAGPISRVANAVQRVANKLTDIPVIAPYAKATALASGATASIAALFGYSRPVNIETSIPFVPHLVGNIANANVKDSSTKLTLDIKQELTVDPRTMGLGTTDEMTISSIAQRESYLTKFAWQVADPTEALIWNTEVNPVTWDMNGTEVHLPACAFATLPFKWWRGTMKYRFQIVASSFHKGRLKIVYDPDFQESNEYNTNYTYIIDIAKERDFTVDIGWGSPTPFLRHTDPGLDPVIFSDGALALNPIGFRNGTLSVYVVNDLTVPNSIVKNDIEVNVFISTGDDFEVAEPSDENISTYTFFDPSAAVAALSDAIAPAEMTTLEYMKFMDRKASPDGPTRLLMESQSGEEPSTTALNQPDSDLTTNESEPMKEMAVEKMAVALQPTDHSGCIFFGDPVSSFRQCLKRYNFHSAVALGGNSLRYFIANNSDFPYHRGYAPSAVDLTSAPLPDTPYNYSKMTLLNYLTPAFEARRGGLRWKYARSVGNSDGSSTASIQRNPANPGNFVTEVTSTTGNNPYVVASEVATLYGSMWPGGLLQPTDQNPVLEFEAPFYQPFRFASGKNANYTSPFADFGSFHQYVSLWSKNNSDTSAVIRYVSVGEDFMLAFYTGPPRMFYAPNDPLPTLGPRP